MSYLGMESWDLQARDRASTITHVDHEKKNDANYRNTMFDFSFWLLIHLHSDTSCYISKYLEATWHLI